jgi:RND family efflux transporter MFP subunit
MPNRAVALSAKIMGRIQVITRDEGQGVKEGETLLVMDDAELQADLASAQASLALAKVELEHRKRVDARMKRLHKTQSISEDELDEGKFRYAAARERYRIAEAEVAKVKALLKETLLIAPFGAVVTAKHAEIGQLIQPGEPLLVLEDHSQLKFRTKVKEQDIPHIVIGQTVYVTIDALNDLRLEGKVSKIIPSGGPTHTFVVEATLPAREKLLPGMFGKAEFVP